MLYQVARVSVRNDFRQRKSICDRQDIPARPVRRALNVQPEQMPD